MCPLFVLVENSHLAHTKGSISHISHHDDPNCCSRRLSPMCVSVVYTWAPDILLAILMHFMLFYFNFRAFCVPKRQYNGRRRLTVHAFVHTKNVYLNLVWLVRARVSSLLWKRPSYIAAAEACFFFASFQMLFIRCRRFSAQNTMSAPNFGPFFFFLQRVGSRARYRERKREREKLSRLKIGLRCCFVLSEIV